MFLSRRAFLVSTLSTIALTPSLALATGKCPGVSTKTGARPPLSIPSISPQLPASRSIPTDWRRIALEIIAQFESGQRNIDAAYGNVSKTDVISLGYLQWNHNAGSLYNRLLKDASEDMISAAPPLVRDDIRRLVRIGGDSKRKREVSAIIAGWRTANDINPDYKSALRTWLLSKPMRDRQDQLLDQRLQMALRYADAWERDFGRATGGENGERAFYTFVDLQVFNGDLAGLWVDHVRQYRNKFSSATEMLDDIAAWTKSCGEFKFQGKVGTGKEAYVPVYKKLYRRRETPLSVAEWQRMAREPNSPLDEATFELLALGYLRASISSGNDAPNGFHGVFELDVLNRRGLVATGRGVLPGQDKVTQLYLASRR